MIGIITLFYIFILGLAIGSFLNVIIDRVANGKKIGGRSYCDHCGKQITWYDLIPLISFILLQRKCRYCKKKISLFYPIVEFVTALLFVLTWLFIPLYQTTPINYPTVVKILYLAIISCLVVIFFTDLKYQIIPDQVQIVFFVLAFFLVLFSKELPSIVPARLLAGFIVLLPIGLIFLISKGKAMGFGDVKLAFIIGFFLGVKDGLLALYFAIILGALAGVFLILLKRKNLKSTIAFGPFLIVGVMMMLFWGNAINEIVMNIYGF